MMKQSPLKLLLLKLPLLKLLKPPRLLHPQKKRRPNELPSRH